MGARGPGQPPGFGKSREQFAASGRLRSVLGRGSGFLPPPAYHRLLPSGRSDTLRLTVCDALRLSSFFGQESPGDKKKATTWETSATCPPNARRAVPRNFPGCSGRFGFADPPIFTTPYLALTSALLPVRSEAILRQFGKPQAVLRIWPRATFSKPLSSCYGLFPHSAVPEPNYNSDKRLGS